MRRLATKMISDKIGFTNKDLQLMMEILDDLNTGYVTSIKFSEFLKGFGPLSRSIEKVHKIIYHSIGHHRVGGSSWVFY